MSLSCELCDVNLGDVIIASPQWRVILVDDPDYPGFCRVIWNAHVKEMTDLSDADKVALMQVVWQVEAAQREVLQPHKINLASFGNMVPHLHWHVIPRYTGDAHFPHPVWAAARTDNVDAAGLQARRALLPRLRETISSRLTDLL
ncbi:HIT family protein [Undibacterium griseum]|uniref:HIT family protein n=1 Tax=Undibacterium griseum TaxID=2762295 RepID=A0ABR6YJQ7_9BURK|nr:HIT family protein [Undibacterium griseum]MBC3884130.1 HIT family protein [Undibacterium griseum]